MPGTKTLVVVLRGNSRQNAIAQIPFGQFGFLQIDQGCVAQPEIRAPQFTHPWRRWAGSCPSCRAKGHSAVAVPPH